MNGVMDYEHSESPRNWVDTSASVGPALLGAAAGLLVADLLHGNARRAVGIAAAALGVAAVTPKLSGTIKNKVAGPQTRRGSAKTLENIRGTGATSEDFGFLDEDDIDSQLGIG